MSEDKTYFIDSNVFIRVFVVDKFFKDCSKLIGQIDADKIKAITSNLVLSEISFVLGGFYGFPKFRVVQALKAVDSLVGLSLKNTCNTKLALKMYQKRNVKFVNCLLASNPFIQSGQITVVSYDKDFDKLGASRVEPKKLI